LEGNGVKAVAGSQGALSLVPGASEANSTSDPQQPSEGTESVQGIGPVQPVPGQDDGVEEVPPPQGGEAQQSTGGIGGEAAITALAEQRLTLAGTPAANGSLGLHVELNDIGYSATLQLGTPPRDFLVLMDSGSADFWVGADNCQSQDGGNCGNHQFLGSQSSSSFEDTRAPWNITYGTGSVAGTIVKDNLNFGGFQVEGLTFGTALVESVEFSSPDTPFDGLMGLARGELSNQATPTPIEALKAQGLVRQAITSYKLARVADGSNDGQITFGGLDETKFDANTLVEVPNVSRIGFWEAQMPSILVNDQNVGLQGRSAILDTGTTLVIAPPADATAIHQAIPGAKFDQQLGIFTVPCNTNVRVALTFGNTAFSIDPRDLAFGQIARGSQDCMSGISAGEFGEATQWLVGDVFLKNAYFSHNVDTNTMSLAKLT